MYVHINYKFMNLGSFDQTAEQLKLRIQIQTHDRLNYLEVTKESVK